MCCYTLSRSSPAAQVSAALERILADVQPGPAAAPLWTLEQQQQQAAFNSANAAVQPAVYYWPDAYRELAELYLSLQQAISAAAPPPPDPKKGQLC